MSTYKMVIYILCVCEYFVKEIISLKKKPNNLSSLSSLAVFEALVCSVLMLYDCFRMDSCLGFN